MDVGSNKVDVFGSAQAKGVTFVDIHGHNVSSGGRITHILFRLCAG